MSTRRRLLKEKAAICITGVAGAITVLILFFIIGTITIDALPSININFLIKSESDAGGFATAIGNAIAGSIYLSCLAVIIALPMALSTAIYLKKYAKDNIFSQTIRLLIEILAGTPSIVIGVVGLVLLSYYLRSITGGWSLISGAIALGVLIFPFIERIIEDSISTVPEELEQASYALGASRWDTIKGVIIPYITSGIATGTVLGIGRAAEESAVVLLTTGYSQFYPFYGIQYSDKLIYGVQIEPLQDSVGTLPIAIYNSFNYPNLVPLSNGMAAAFVLICIVFSINLGARLIISRWNTQPAYNRQESFNTKLASFFKKKGPGNSGSLIPHVGIFNRSKPEPTDKQIENITPDIHNKPDISGIGTSIRPYLADPLTNPASSPRPSPVTSEPEAASMLPRSQPANQMVEDTSSGETAPAASGSVPTIEILPEKLSQLPSVPGQSDKSPAEERLNPLTDTPQPPENKALYPTFVVDPVKLTREEVLSEETGALSVSTQAHPSLPAPSVEPVLPATPIQLTNLTDQLVPEHASDPIHVEEPAKPTIEVIREPAPAQDVDNRADDASLLLQVKEDKPVKPPNPKEKIANGLWSRTNDGKPFLNLLPPRAKTDDNKNATKSSMIVSHVSDAAMPYTINNEPAKDPTGLLSSGYVELSPADGEPIGDSGSQVASEKPYYNILREPAVKDQGDARNAAVQPTPDKINDITHTVSEPQQPKAKTNDFDLFNIFGGFKKNGNGHNGKKPNSSGSEGSAQAAPTEEEVTSTLQKSTKNNLLSSLNLGFSKPKVPVELIEFNVGKLSIPLLEGALKDTDVTYEIDPPFQYVRVFFDGQEMTYNVLEPTLSAGEKKYMALIERSLEKLISSKIVAIRPEEREDFLRQRFSDIVRMYGFNLSEAHQDRIFYYLRKSYLGLGKIDIIMKDHYIEDVSCNGPNNYLYVYHRVFGSVRTNVSFEEVELNKFVMRMAQISGKHISILQPIKDVTMPDGSRANITMGSEVTKKGATFTIRKFRDKPMSPIELMEYNSIDPLCLAYLWILLDYKKSILVSGGTASGKTTLLNVICSFIRPENKIVSLEDTAELNLVHPNWIQSVTRSGFGAEAGSNSISGVSGVSAKSPGDIGLYDLLVAALRQRPEYIICGEVRGAEAFTMFQAIAVGHACMGTIHAGTMRELLSRIESNPMNVPRTLFSALDAVCFNAMVRHHDRNVRRVMMIVEILELDANGDLVTNPVFRWDAKTDKFVFTGKSHIFEKIEDQLGVREQDLVREMQARAQFLRSLRENGIREYAAVVENIHEYTLNHG